MVGICGEISISKIVSECLCLTVLFLDDQESHKGEKVSRRGNVGSGPWEPGMSAKSRRGIASVGI